MGKMLKSVCEECNIEYSIKEDIDDDTGLVLCPSCGNYMEVIENDCK